MKENQDDNFVALASGDTVLQYTIQNLLSRNEFSITYLAFDSSRGRHCWLEEYFPVSIAKRQEASLTPAPLYREAFAQGLSFFEEEVKNYQKITNESLPALFEYFTANGTAYGVLEAPTLQDTLFEKIEENRLELFKKEPDLLKNFFLAIQSLQQAGLGVFEINPHIFAFNDKNLPVFLGLAQARLRLAQVLKQSETVESHEELTLYKITAPRKDMKIDKNKEVLILSLAENYHVNSFFLEGQTEILEKVWSQGLIAAVKQEKTRLYPVMEQLFAPFLEMKRKKNKVAVSPWFIAGGILAIGAGITTFSLLNKQEKISENQQQISQTTALAQWETRVAETTPMTLIHWQELLKAIAAANALNTQEQQILQEQAYQSFLNYLQNLLTTKRFQEIAFISEEVEKTLEQWQLAAKPWQDLQNQLAKAQQREADEKKAETIQSWLKDNANLLEKTNRSLAEEQNISDNLQKIQNLAPLSSEVASQVLEQTTALVIPYLLQGEQALAAENFSSANNLLKRAQALDTNNLVLGVGQLNQKYVRLRQEAQERKAQAQREAQLRAQREAQLQAEREAQLRAQREAQLRAQREAQLQAEREAQLQAEREARLQAEQKLKERETQTHRELQLRAEQQAKEEEAKAHRALQLRAEQETKGREAQLQAEREAQLQAEREAQLQAEREALMKMIGGW